MASEWNSDYSICPAGRCVLCACGARALSKTLGIFTRECGCVHWIFNTTHCSDKSKYTLPAVRHTLATACARCDARQKFRSPHNRFPSVGRCGDHRPPSPHRIMDMRVRGKMKLCASHAHTQREFAYQASSRHESGVCWGRAGGGRENPIRGRRCSCVCVHRRTCDWCDCVRAPR